MHGDELGHAEGLVVAAVEPGAGAREGAARARLRGLDLVGVVHGEVVGLAHLDHGGEAVGLEVVEVALEAGHQAQRQRAVGEGRARRQAARFHAVGDGVSHLLRDLGDARHQPVEELVAATLGLDHGELQGHVGIGQDGVHDPAQVVEVLARDHAIRREVEPATAEILQRAVGLLEGVGTNQQIVDARRASVEREVDVAQALGEQALHQLGVGEHAPVGHQAEVHVQRRDLRGPVDQLRANRGLAAGEHDRAMPELLGAADLARDLLARALHVAHLERVAEATVVVAGVAHLDQRLHRDASRAMDGRPGGSRCGSASWNRISGLA